MVVGRVMAEACLSLPRIQDDGGTPALGAEHNIKAAEARPGLGCSHQDGQERSSVPSPNVGWLLDSAGNVYMLPLLMGPWQYYSCLQIMLACACRGGQAQGDRG